MAFLSANLSLVHSSPGTGNRIWLYQTTDSFSQVCAATYFFYPSPSEMVAGDQINVATFASALSDGEYASLIAFNVGYISSVTASGATASSNFVLRNVSTNLSAGYTATAEPIGPVSSGTVTINQANGDYHTLTNNGAFALAPPSLTAPANCASGVVEVLNGVSAGAVTTSAWTHVTGSFDTTNAHIFQCDYCITPNASSLNIRAMQ